MYKYILLASSVIGLLGHNAEARAPHSGVSFGANLGHASVDGKLNRTINTNPIIYDKSNLGSRSPVFGLFLGYGWTAAPSGFHLGGELFGQIENFNAKREDLMGNRAFGLTTKLRSKNTFGAAAKIGYIHKDMLFYGKVGAASTKWKLNYAYPAAVATLAAPARDARDISKNSRKTGLLVGAGMDYAITNNWSIGAEYVYTMYKAVKLAVPAAPGAAASVNLSHKPTVSTFNARVKYTF